MTAWARAGRENLHVTIPAPLLAGSGRRCSPSLTTLSVRNGARVVTQHGATSPGMADQRSCVSPRDANREAGDILVGERFDLRDAFSVETDVALRAGSVPARIGSPDVHRQT